jgi:S-adenosylmethionine hydrolase
MAENITDSTVSLGPIVLMTDFGDEDPYLGQMKGVIAAIAPGVQVLDLCNNVPKHNIVVAAAFLKGSWKFFPKGGIFVIVVDPGVGTERKAILLKTRDRYFIAPDNGCLTEILGENIPWEAVEIHNPRYMLRDISATFHGRDIFAPVAAHLAKGVSLLSFGPRVQELTQLSVPKPRFKDGIVHGVITHIDHFGNAWTNITQEFLEQLGWMEDPSRIVATVSSCKIKGLKRTYMDGETGKPLVLINSFTLMEIAWPGESAKERMRLWEGTWVDVQFT